MARRNKTVRSLNLWQTAWLLFLTPLLIPSLAEAKNLQGRLGLGFNNEFVNSTAAARLPGISLKYGLTKDIAAEAVLGVATTSPANNVTALKIFKNIFYETDINFYFMLGGGLVASGGTTGVEFLGGFGAEFFIPGVESLGLAIETGASLDNISGSFVARTLGVSFLDAGIHFYF